MSSNNQPLKSREIQTPTIPTPPAPPQATTTYRLKSDRQTWPYLAHIYAKVGAFYRHTTKKLLLN